MIGASDDHCSLFAQAPDGPGRAQAAMCVKSAAQVRFGAGATKSRSSRSGAREAAGRFCIELHHISDVVEFRR